MKTPNRKFVKIQEVGDSEYTKLTMAANEMGEYGADESTHNPGTELLKSSTPTPYDAGYDEVMASHLMEPTDIRRDRYYSIPQPSPPYENTRNSMGMQV
jgi:hypothetical protein